MARGCYNTLEGCCGVDRLTDYARGKWLFGVMDRQATWVYRVRDCRWGFDLGWSGAATLALEVLWRRYLACQCTTLVLEPIMLKSCPRISDPEPVGAESGPLIAVLVFSQFKLRLLAISSIRCTCLCVLLYRQERWFTNYALSSPSLPGEWVGGVWSGGH